MPELKRSEIIYRGFLFELRKEFWEEKEKVIERDVVDHRGAVCILPVFKNNTIVLIKQFRHAIREYLLEIPAGLLEYDESPEQTALRELQEEIGAQTERLARLGSFYTSPGYSTEIIHFFQADISDYGVQSLDEDEFIDVVPVAVEEFYRMIDVGLIKDSKTIIAGLLWKWQKES